MLPARPGPSRATARAVSCRQAGPSMPLRPCRSGRCGSPPNAERPASSRHRADRSARRHAARADGPALRQDVALRLDQALGHAFEPITPLIPKETPTASRCLRRADRPARGSQEVVRRLAEGSVPATRTARRRRAPPRPDPASARRSEERLPARRDGQGQPGCGASRQALRRAAANHRSRLRHRGDHPRRQQGRAAEARRRSQARGLGEDDAGEADMAGSSTVSAPASA